MHLKSLFLGALLLSVGFVSCKQDKITENPTKGNTYVGLSLQFASSGGNGLSRAAGLPDDYHHIGTWKGRDDINTIHVFLVNTAKGTIDFNSFGKESFETITQDGFLKPNLAIKSTAGYHVQAYVVVNGSAETIERLKGTPVANFDNAFKGLETQDVNNVAKYVASDKEQVMMTNSEDAAIDVKEGISENDAKAGTNNILKVKVNRVASRALVTMNNTAEAKNISARINGVEQVVGTVSDIKYAVGQVNKSFYLMAKSDYETPLYSYAIGASDWQTLNNKFDYSGLNSFTTVTEIQEDNSANTEEIGKILKAEKTSKFVLPLTHDKYQKGNTTYIEIQAKFTPKENIWGDKTTDLSTIENKSIWLGANGKFYATKEHALNPEDGGVATQKVGEFKNGIMKYIVWLNPDDIKKPTKSPVVRNQIYHVHISKFASIGLNSNPLKPNDPENPEPEPGPGPSPIKPDDPLSTPKTYLSVNITVLNWGVHSYKLDLSNDNY